MTHIINIEGLSKTYANGFEALKNINLQLHEGEIFALLGPNGAGKTTLISTICGTALATSGQITVQGLDIHKNYRTIRSLIGLVPQELTTDAFETVWDTVSFTRGLFGKKPNPELIQDILTRLSLLEKKDAKLLTLSGGMKRRVMIAKALSHEPRLLFLDEPTAGVDVELRKGMWQEVRALRERGVTIVLTTHYLEEAEEMADRIGIINRGEITLVEQKKHLLNNLGTKKLIIELQEDHELPTDLQQYGVEKEGNKWTYSFDAKNTNNGIDRLLHEIQNRGLTIRDITTKQSSLEEIFVNLVGMR